MITAREQLDLLLRETPPAARIRQEVAFDEAALGRHRVVVFGAGRLGRMVFHGLAGTDLNVVAFTDNNPRTWGTMACGVPVLSPADAARKHAHDAAFVVAVWHPTQSRLMSALLTQLHARGCCAVPFPLLFWRHAGTFLPYFFWNTPERLLQQSNDIIHGFEILHDELSREAFVAQVQLRLLADFECGGAPCPDEQYFTGLFSLNSDECFIDCGAYTGDTIRALLSLTGGRFRKVIAFEADPAVMPGLLAFGNGVDSRVVIHNAAVAAHNGVVHFSGDGIGGGCIASSSGIEVPCVRLDSVLAGETVSYIKMDIEGAELVALEGAHRSIWRNRPILAICGYHKPDHLWRVPVSLHSLAPDSALFLRAHCADGLDSVYYSVPPERQIQPAAQRTHPPARPAHSRSHAQGSSS